MPVVVQCSSCQTRFKLADDKIKTTGTKVRCTKCREVFTVYPLREEAAVQAVVDLPKKDTSAEQQPTFASTESLFPDRESIEAHISAPPAPPAVDDSVWQEKDFAGFADAAAADSAASDIDAINFENMEAPVFSVTTESSAEAAFDFSETFNDSEAFSFDAAPELAPLVGPEASTSQPFGEEFNPSSAFPESDTFAAPESAPATSEGGDADFTPTLPDSDFSFAGSASETATLDAESLFASDDTSSDFTWEGSDSTAFETETVPGNITEQKEALADSDFDFSSFSFDDVAAPEPSATKESEEALGSEAASIELSVEEEPPAPPVLNSRIPTEYPKPNRPPEHEEAPPRPAARPSRPRARQKKKTAPLLAFKLILGIFFVVALIFGLINREKIQNGYRDLVSRYIENQIPAEKSGQIGLNKLTGGYLSSSQGGDLFIIRGEAVNEYVGLRSSILVRGTIYGANGTILQSQTTYCGNSLTDGKLKKMAFKEILEAMSNELGENLSNLNIAPGKAVPFTIVFRDAPKNITEYTVEIVESKPGSN